VNPAPNEDPGEVSEKEEFEGVEDPETTPGLSASAIIQELEASNDWMLPDAPITDGSVSWRPDLLGSDGERLLHVHLADELRSYLRSRLTMAAASGKRVVVALRLESLYQGDVVEFLGEIDADVIVIEVNEEVSLADARHILTALSDRSVPVSLPTRKKVARCAWDRRSEGSSSVKGKRFEGLLAFLLDQVADFRVVERNLRGATDEVDLVLQIDNWSPRCWHLQGVPFVLVEAKNWKDPVGQPTVTVFNGKLRTKRQTSRIGLLFSASTFTADAKMQELKFATDPEVIVMIDGEQLDKWIDSNQPDDDLEEIVRKGMLR